MSKHVDNMNSYYRNVNESLKTGLMIEAMLAKKLGLSIAEFRNTPIVSLRARLLQQLF